MIKPTETTTTPDRAPEPKPATSSGTGRDELMKALEANRRFTLIKSSGQGFVIGGQSPKAR